MTFQVRWLPRVEEQLAAIWRGATDRAAINRASHAMDELLRSEPEAVGESREEDLRILLEPPLGLIDQISIPDRTVLVLSVRYFGKRREDNIS